MLQVACVMVENYCGRGAEYVEKLYDGVRRNLRLGFPGKFVCFTDDPDSLKHLRGVETRALPCGLSGWWNKLALFAPDAFPRGDRVLYFDLDTVITGPLDELAAYAGPFAILRDVYRPNGLQSSVMSWEAGSVDYLWSDWLTDGKPRMAGGDQHWIERNILGKRILQELFPGKFRSYKVDCRSSIPCGTSVVFFHGHPRPHEVDHGWVPEVWKVGGGSGVEFIVESNTDEATLQTHVSSAIQRGGQWLECGQDSRTAIIVGGGPSLADNLHYIRGMQLSDAVIYATGNTFAFLKQHGIRADAHVLLDARRDNIDFVPHENVPKFYASQCHPDVLEAADLNLICWHAALTSYQPLIEREQPGMLGVGGGTTVGLKAIALAFILGHRHFRLFGFDSSYGPSHHAYDQPLNDGERTVDYTVAGRTFKCAPWMVTQAEDFKQLMPLLLEQGCVVRIFGDGLIPHIASLLGSRVDIMEIDGLWWPANDVHARHAVLGTVPDLHRYIERCAGKEVAVQAGGNVGVWPRVLAEHFERVITFEPDPLNFACLERNVKDRPNVSCFQGALGDIPQLVGVQQEPGNCGASCVNGRGSIPLMALDSLALTRCDLLQLDVEGYELKALKGAEQTIRRCSPLIVLELKGLGERYGDSDADTIDYLAALGYHIEARAHRDVVFRRIDYAARTA